MRVGKAQKILYSKDRKPLKSFKVDQNYILNIHVMLHPVCLLHSTIIHSISFSLYASIVSTLWHPKEIMSSEQKPVGVLFGNTFNLIMLFLACQTTNQKEWKFFFRQLNGKSCLFAIVASNEICMLLIFMCCWLVCCFGGERKWKRSKTVLHDDLFGKTDTRYE